MLYPLSYGGRVVERSGSEVGDDPLVRPWPAGLGSAAMTDFLDHYGPWAVVTGAAQGVGLAFVEELHERGLGVVLVDRNDAVVDVAAGLKGDTRALVADVTDPGWIAALEAVVGDVEIGLAVANAGVSFVKHFLDMTAEERRLTLGVNAGAVTDLAAWSLPPMVDRGRGGFVVTSSGSALAGVGGVGLYSATKAFTVNLVEAIGWEIRDSGVHTQAVVAPSMETPAFVGHNPDLDAMFAPMVDPRDVVRGALDALPNGGRYLADEGLEFAAQVPRADRVDMMSQATTAMYPHIFGS
ncbi:MAG: short-chain dehydrogenase [Acidimicrobiales bacterium]|nr:MAG: short-chain dehydrogenase [Acidimicrobiales bacterium]